MKKIGIFIFISSILVNGVWAQDSFFSEESFSDESSSPIEINGHVTAGVRAGVSAESLKAVADLDNVSDQVEAVSELGLKINYEGADFAVHSDINFAPVLEDGKLTAEVKLNEVYGQYFGQNINIEAGYMKVVWGKADEFHVVDVLNNLNWSDFLVPDYLEMLDPELMFKINVPIGMSSQLELAYVPFLTVDRFPGSGEWQPMETVEFEAGLYDTIITAAGSGITLSANNISSSTKTLDHSQAALHFTSSAAGFDYGFTYYAGYNKMPSITAEQNMTSATEGTIDYSLSYDPMHIFGVEAAYILAGFNIKGEFSYHMTYDFEGDDPEIHNNSIRWVAGFDRDIPLGNLNINIQEAGTLILNNDKLVAGDIEHDADEHYTQNLLIASISDKFLHDKLEIKVIGFYHFEESDFGIYPAIEFKPVDDFTFELEGRFFGGDDDTLFGQYKDNSFVEFTLKWDF